MEKIVRNSNQKWQDVDGFVQALEVHNGKRVLYCSGQLSVSSEGEPLFAGNMDAQLNTALDNLEALLKSAGFALSDIVRLQVYTTDMDLCLKNYSVIVNRLSKAGCQPACTLLGVNRLAWVESLVELEATAVAD